MFNLNDYLYNYYKNPFIFFDSSTTAAKSDDKNR